MHRCIMRASRRAGAALLLGACAAAAQAAPAGFDLSLLAARATTDDVSKAGLVAGWTHPDPLWQGSRWQLALRHEVELSFWHVPRARDLIEFGYSPVLRLERPAAGGALFFLEASIGVRALSHTRVSDRRDLSSSFQFADILGAGWQWGPHGRSTLGVRIQHISNAGLKKPNPGINFGQVYYRYRF